MPDVPGKAKCKDRRGDQIIAPGLEDIGKRRQRQQHEDAGCDERKPGSQPNLRPYIEGGPMHQHRQRQEQPHEVVLPRQRRGHRHQAEQDAELLGVRAHISLRLPRHDGDKAEPEQRRHRQHDPVRRPVVDVDEIHRARRLTGVLLIVVDRPDQAVRHRDDGLVDP